MRTRTKADWSLAIAVTLAAVTALSAPAAVAATTTEAAKRLQTPAGVTSVPAAPVRPDGVTRLAGPDRYATAIAISASSFPGGSDVAFVVTGTDWPDALAAGAAAASVDAPVLLVAGSGVPPVVATELARLTPAEVVIVGGESAVGAGVQEALAALYPTRRLGGASRYATAAQVAAAYLPGAPGAYYASGEGYADALAGGAAAARRGWPLLLTPRSSLSSDTPVLGGPSIALGGAAALTDEVVAGLDARRVAGTDRYGTAAQVALDAFGPARVGYLATGANFPDALAGAPAAARDGAPILLVPGPCLTPVTAEAAQSLGVIARVVLGGESVVAGAAADLQSCPALAPAPAPAPAPGPPPSHDPAAGVPPASAYDCPASHPVKGNQSGIYHVPGGKFYDVTTPLACFESEAAAQGAGYRASRAG